MHIVIAPSWYPNNENDLSGIFFRDQGIALKKAGSKVTVAYVETRSATMILKDLRGGREWRPETYIVENQLKEYRSRIYNYFLKLPFGKEWLIYRKFKKLISEIEKREGKIDLIHLHSFLSHGYAVARICKKKNIPYVMTEHYSGIEKNSLRKHQNKIIKMIGNTASELIAVGSGGARYLAELTGRTVKIIPNMVDVSHFDPSKHKTSSSLKILSIGYLNYRKGFDLLIDAFGVVEKEFPQAELVIAGEGAERANLEDQIKRIEMDEPSIKGKISLKGAVMREDLPALLADSTFFALASRDEAFGVVLIEALAMGKAVVATANAGPKRIINNACGVLVENENVDSLAKGLLHVIKKHKSYNNEDIRHYCVENFSEKAVVTSLNDIYKKYC